MNISNNAALVIIVVAALSFAAFRTWANRRPTKTPAPVTVTAEQLQGQLHALIAEIQTTSDHAKALKETTWTIPTYDPANTTKQNGHATTDG